MYHSVPGTSGEMLMQVNRVPRHAAESDIAPHQFLLRNAGMSLSSWSRDALLALLFLSVATVAQAQTSDAALVGRWQYRQPPDTEGEVLDVYFSSGRYRAILNGLERAGEHGLFYYVVEPADLAVAADGSISFTVGARTFFSKRPPLSRLGGEGGSGASRERMRFQGRIAGADLVLKCEGPPGSCPDTILRFKRISTR
jgi:hypothetical protein